MTLDSILTRRNGNDESRHFGLFINSLCVLSGFSFVRTNSSLSRFGSSGDACKKALGWFKTAKEGMNLR